MCQDHPFPYDLTSPYQRWREGVLGSPSTEVDPQRPGRFRIGRSTRVSSAGSCFAARIAEGLRTYGFDYHVVEPGPSWLSTEDRVAYNYGVYSARYGEIYTALQLAQLLERALGRFTPVEDLWEGPEGFLDPFRPRIQPRGFESAKELRADRESHLAAIKRLFRETEVFVFTLGLTECWRCVADGAALPVCPGRSRGRFDPARYRFGNLTVGETVESLERFLDAAFSLNPGLRVLLTVSPVPLAATMEDRHVLASTVYSKSVLRVAAEEIRRRHDRVDYFAAYEIVTATGNTPAYFETDRRSVTDPAVRHVLSSFFRNFTDEDPDTLRPVPASEAPEKFAPQPCDEDDLLARLEADSSVAIPTADGLGA